MNVVVLSNGLAMGISERSPGSLADSKIFLRRLSWHRSELHKSETEKYVFEKGSLVEQFEDGWIVFENK